MDFDSSGFRQKKSLGQVFLKEQWPVTKVVDHLKAMNITRVLEIGPGGGVLTRSLVEAGINVTSVEKDTRLIEKLEDYFYLRQKIDPKQFKVLNIDILKFDLDSWLKESNEPTAVCGNIPYNISSPILLWCIPHLPRIKGACFLVQLEFAQRVCGVSSTKSYGSLSVYTQLRSKAEIISKVDRTCFQPVPKVDSAIISLKPIPNLLDKKLLQKVELITRIAFTQRRKMLRNATSQFLDRELESTCPIDLSRRPDALKPEEFVQLAQFIFFNSSNVKKSK